MPSILIAADICPIGVNNPLFRSGNAAALFNDLLPEFEKADLVVANLECPLVDQPSPIFKTGPNFGEATDCIRGIKAAGIDILSLANNHILDHGAPGLKSTMAACASASIETVGAGENLSQARRILIRKAGNTRVGFLSVAEHEFSIATKTSAGANPLDIIDFVRNVREQRSEFDYLVVLLHGAHEFQPVTPRIQDTCRFMVEMGANAVIVQHPHSLGGYEHYQGGLIVYGQGALVMDEEIYRKLTSFHEGFLVKLDLGSSGAATMEILPFTQSDPEPGARLMHGAKKDLFCRELEQRSAKLATQESVLGQWLEFCEERKHGYMASLLGFNRVMKRLNKGGAFLRLLYRDRPLLGVRNIVQCETHREAIRSIFDHSLLKP